MFFCKPEFYRPSAGLIAQRLAKSVDCPEDFRHTLDTLVRIADKFDAENADRECLPELRRTLGILKSQVLDKLNSKERSLELGLDAVNVVFDTMFSNGKADGLNRDELDEIKNCLKQEMMSKAKPATAPVAAPVAAQAADQEAELAMVNARLQAALVNVKQLLVQAGELNQQLMSLGIDLAEARQQAVAAQIEEEFLDLTDVAPTATPVIEPAVAVAEVIDIDDLEPEPAGKPTRPARAKASGK